MARAQIMNGNSVRYAIKVRNQHFIQFSSSRALHMYFVYADWSIVEILASDWPNPMSAHGCMIQKMVHRDQNNEPYFRCLVNVVYFVFNSLRQWKLCLCLRLRPRLLQPGTAM